MNVNLSWQATILSVSVVEDQLIANNYSLGIDFITNTSDTRCQNIAFERMKFMLAKIFDQSIFISINNKLLPKISTMFPSNLVILPEEAYDQIVNLSIYCKLNAIMEKSLIIDSMTISSSVNDDITYTFNHGDNLGPFALNARKKVKPWWARPDLRTSDSPSGHFPIDAWEELGLGFNSNVPPSKKLTKEKKSSYNAKVDPHEKGFHPEIIIGGKKTDTE